ncbi:MAG TPA: MerR family transcriptional regulator [bacterium]|nr:MerR family transcriptional regulator [bacterium]
MPEEEKLFYSIGEAAQMLDVKPYVLRYWETEFRKLNPQKSPTGQRTYKSRDLRVAATIKRLLYGEKYTIAGAVQKLQELDAQAALDPFPGEDPKPRGTSGPSFQEISAKVEGPPEGTNMVLQKHQGRPKEKVVELFHLIEKTKSILGKYPILR